MDGKRKTPPLEALHAKSHASDFETTHWSVVLQAGLCSSSGSNQALSELCQSYWLPLYSYVRRRVQDAHEAQDLTQAFFTKLLEKNHLRTADPSRGRFRAFLLTALKRFMANELARWTSILLLTVPFVYTIAFESLVGWTPIRRFFGLRLLNHAGERSSWSKRLIRAILKCLLLCGIFFLTALLSPLLNRSSDDLSITVALMCIWILSPLYVMYLPARWIPSQWTYYDLLAGVTWAEESQGDFAPLVHHQTDVVITPQGSAVDRIDQYDVHETLGSGGMAASIGRMIGYSAGTLPLKCWPAISCAIRFCWNDSSGRHAWQPK